MQFGVQNHPSFGRNSNDPEDPGFKKHNPDFAAPHRKGESRINDGNGPDDPHLMGEELVPKAVRAAQAAIKDPVLAIMPEVKLWDNGKDWEPIDPKQKKFSAPIFLVDPKFTDTMADDHKSFFSGHYHGGHGQPIIAHQWPIVTKQVQDFFHVGPDCSCRTAKERPVVVAKEPVLLQMNLPAEYAPCWEPQYEDPSYRKPSPHMDKDMIFKGDDYGGYNIPFPLNPPPTPHPMYDQHAFVDLHDVYGIPKLVQPKEYGPNHVSDHELSQLRDQYGVSSPVINN